jgi:hypothetical protein
MLNVNLTLLKLNKIYIRLVSSSILAAIALGNGWIPEISLQSLQPGEVDQQLTRGQLYHPSVAFSVHAYSQQFTPEEAINYAKAGYQVEILRRQVYQEIQTLINEAPPNIVCDQQTTISDLKPEVRAIAEKYCNQSQQIVQQNNLTIDRFNQLKVYYDRRDGFYQQVQDILLKLQN